MIGFPHPTLPGAPRPLTLARIALLGALAWQPVQANYPCPSGPGPGESQIGTMGGSHGIASIPICASNGGGDEGYGHEEPMRGTGEISDLSPEMLNLYEAVTGQTLATTAAMNEADKRRREIEADPGQQRFRQGEWKFFQGRKNSAPGEACVAMWVKQGGLVSITGPGPDYDGGMLTFWSPDIPTPKDTQTVSVTLKQSKYPAQSVKALNFSVPNIEFGAIGLTVPTIDAAMKTMLDVEHFELEMDGKTIAKVDWTGGLAARDQLQKCVARRKA